MIDSITAEVVRNFLHNAADQVYEAICRTSPNPGVNESKDCGAGVYSYDGSRVKIVSAAGIITHAFEQMTSAQACVDFFRGDLHPGDVLLVADSFHGGSHLGCRTIIVPIFVDGRPRFLTAARLHVLDQGGPAPGAVNPLCREIWHEGLRLPPLKLYEKGARRQEVWDWLCANNRLPDMMLADMDAMIGACKMGEVRIRELVERWSLKTVENSLAWIFGHSQRSFVERIRKWPDGVYRAEFFADSDYADQRNLAIRVAITIDGERMTIDFAGTDPQVDGLVNSVSGNTIAWICAALAVICPDIPINSGFFEPLTILLPEGTLVNAVSPAPTVLGTVVVGGQIAQAVMKACEQFVPERVGNICLDGAACYVFGSDERAERFLTHSKKNPGQFFFWDMSMVAMCSSAAYGTDGWGCWAAPFSVANPVNHEFTEVQQPTLYQQAELFIDSAAPGQWRGTPAYVMRRIDRGAANVFANFAAQSLIYPLPGYAGGYEGAGNFYIVAEGTENERICGEHPLAEPYQAPKVIFSHCGGGGGWGDPLDRDPAAVLDDVLDEYVSVEGAEKDYGVIIDTTTWRVREEQTAGERARRKADPAPRVRRGLGREWAIDRAKIRHLVGTGTSGNVR
jgi:N-methylhydantoinase B